MAVHLDEEKGGNISDSRSTSTASEKGALKHAYVRHAEGKRCRSWLTEAVGILGLSDTEKSNVERWS
jgi:hypothetical protein